MYYYEMTISGTKYDVSAMIPEEGDEFDFPAEKLPELESAARRAMFATLQRVQAENPEAEFEGWRAVRPDGSVVREGDTLTVEVS